VDNDGFPGLRINEPQSPHKQCAPLCTGFDVRQAIEIKAEKWLIHRKRSYIIVVVSYMFKNVNNTEAVAAIAFLTQQKSGLNCVR